MRPTVVANRYFKGPYAQAEQDGGEFRVQPEAVLAQTRLLKIPSGTSFRQVCISLRYESNSTLVIVVSILFPTAYLNDW